MLVASAASAKQVRLPLTVDPAVIREEVVRKVFAEPGERAVFWGTPGDCSFFYLEKPEVTVEAGHVRVLAHGESRVGAEFLGRCVSPIGWSGFVETFETPRLADWVLHFDVTESNVYDERREKTFLGGQLWDRIKSSVQPSLRSVTVDLAPPFAELRSFLPLLLPPERARPIQAALASLHPVSVEASPSGVTIETAMDVEEAAAPATQAAPEAPLSPAEAAAFTRHLDQWDAFLTFVVKSLGEKALSEPARRALFETLIDARYEVVAALGQPSRRRDPVRALFAHSWERLRPAAAEIAARLPGAEALRVLTFLAAGDALRALDTAGPSLGIEISADGLRRMARMIEPGTAADPLAMSETVDPQLRQLFEFGPAIEADSPAPVATPAGVATPSGAPPGAPVPTAPGERPPPAALPTPDVGFWQLLSPPDAWAAEPADRSAAWQGWIFKGREDVLDYLHRVGALLQTTVRDGLRKSELDGSRAELYRRLVPATAWQESCWRQFLPRAGTVTYLRSARGSVGMLQVNERVWRGFYDLDALRWRIRYNARAGSEILLHYVDLALADAAPLTVDALDPAARAVYAGYNGGPSQLRRYRDAKRRGRKLSSLIDEAFGAKFDAVGDGVEARVARCLVGEG